MVSGAGFTLFIRHYYGSPVWFHLPPLTYMLKFSGYPRLTSGCLWIARAAVTAAPTG